MSTVRREITNIGCRERCFIGSKNHLISTVARNIICECHGDTINIVRCYTYIWVCIKSGAFEFVQFLLLLQIIHLKKRIDIFFFNVTKTDLKIILLSQIKTVNQHWLLKAVDLWSILIVESWTTVIWCQFTVVLWSTISLVTIKVVVLWSMKIWATVITDLFIVKIRSKMAGVFRPLFDTRSIYSQFWLLKVERL